MPPARQPGPLSPFISNPWLLYPNAPQGRDEPDAAYWMRSRLAPLAGVLGANVGETFGPPIRAAINTPRQSEQNLRSLSQPGILDAALAGTRRAAAGGGAPTAPAAAFANAAGGGYAPNGARGWRNNNPGNLEASAWTRAQPGYQGSDGRFAIFNSPEAGIAAQERLLRGSRRYFGGGQRSVQQIVDAYLGNDQGNSPASRANYVSYLARRLGVNPNQPLDATSSSQMAAAMREFENGQQQGPATGPGAAPPGMEAYNEWFGAFNQQVGQAERAALTPTDLTFNMPSAPELPAPAHYAAPDFAAGNAAFEQARPRNPFAEPGSEHRLLRENFFRGMAEAMLSIQPGRPVGFGELLMRAGAGALGGRMRGADEVRQRMDRYDGMMQQYNLALANRNDAQATSTANVINQNIQLDNEHARAQAAQNLQEFHQRNRVDLQGNSVIVYSGEGNRQSVHVVPIESMVRQQFGVMRAQALLQGAGAAQQNAQWAFSTANTMALQYAALGIGQGTNAAESGESLAHSLSASVVPMVDSGIIQNVIGQEGYQQVRQEFESRFPQDPLAAASAGAAQQREQQWRDYLATFVVRQAMLNPQLANQLLTVRAGVAGRAVERVRSERTTVRRSRTGTTSSTTYEASDE
jgi:hypothetical protein